MTQAGTNRIGELVRGLLDRGYQQATAATLQAIGSSVTSGVVAQRLKELEAEAARLAEVNRRLTPDNPVLRALLADLDTELKRDTAQINAGATNAQQAGIQASASLTRQLALPGISDQQLALIGVRWNVPDPDAVARLVNYVNSSAWAQEIAKYPGLVLGVVRNQAVMGIMQGWGPVTTARLIRQASQSMTVAQANTLMRTVQLTSYRDATAIHQKANADILTEQIRIATLDDRTCMACVALHGTVLPVGARVEDHHNGRCTSIGVVKGRPRSVQSGVNWFDGLPESRQRTIAGPGAYEAIRAGKASLRDFVQPYTDPVFGDMLREASLKGILG